MGKAGHQFTVDAKWLDELQKLNIKELHVEGNMSTKKLNTKYTLLYDAVKLYFYLAGKSLQDMEPGIRREILGLT